MYKPGTRVKMTKDYRGVAGAIVELTEASYEYYLIRLDNGINMVAGPSAFMVEKDGA